MRTGHRLPLPTESAREVVQAHSDHGQGVSDDGSGRFRLRLSPRVILVYLLVIGAMLALGWYAGTRSNEERRIAISIGTDTGDGQLSDNFERPESTGGPVALGPTDDPKGLSWAALGTGFEAVGGTGRVAATPAGETSMAITNPGHADVTLLAVIDHAPQGSGLVFRLQDVFNHWSLISAPDFGTWNLVLTVDGQIAYSQGVGLVSTEPGTALAIGLNGPNIRVFVDGQPALALVDPTFQQATAVGLIGVNGSGAAVDEFTVAISQLPLAPANDPANDPADTGSTDETGGDGRTDRGATTGDG